MLFILTGPKGSGKTTLLEKVVHVLRERGLKIDGFLSLALREGGAAVGYDLFCLETRESVPLLRKGDDPASERTGPYTFMAEGLEVAERVIRGASALDLLVVDEIGPKEMKGGGFWPALERILFPPSVHCLFVMREDLAGDFLVDLQRTDILVFNLWDCDTPGAVADCILTECRDEEEGPR